MSSPHRLLGPRGTASRVYGIVAVSRMSCNKKPGDHGYGRSNVLAVAACFWVVDLVQPDTWRVAHHCAGPRPINRWVRACQGRNETLTGQRCS